MKQLVWKATEVAFFFRFIRPYFQLRSVKES